MPHVTVIAPTLPQRAAATGEEQAKRRVAAYARVSTDSEDQHTSYEAQIRYYTQFILAHADWELAGVYTDDGVTGTSTKKRRGFQAMVKEALAGRIDLIVTKSVSRFARNTVDSLRTIRALKERGVEVYFEKENIRTFDGKGELLLTIMSSLAQEESRSISDNVTWGMRESMRQGKAWVPFKVFLGYDRGPDGAWVVVPEQAALVRRIYGMFLNGMSPYRIGKVLEQEGVEFSEGKRRWYPSTVTSILKNEKYKGDALRQKTYTRDFLSKERLVNRGELQQYYIHGHHEAIISPELFDRVQLELKRRGTAEERRGGDRLFSRRVRCGDCGGWFGPCVWAYGTPREKLMWRCNHKYEKGKPHCAPPAMSEEALREKYLAAVDRLLQDRDRLADAVAKAKAERCGVDGFLAEQAEQEKELAAVETLMRTAPPARYAELDRRAELAERRLEELRELIEDRRLRETELTCFLRELTIRERTEGFDEPLWYNLVDHMTVYSRERVTVTFKDGTELEA